MKQTLILLGIFAAIIGSTILFESKLNSASTMVKEKAMTEKSEKEREQLEQQKAFEQRLRTKAEKALVFARNEGFDLNHAFLVDFNIHSGKNRFFVWDYKADSILYSSLCAHGCGTGDNKSSFTDIKYSNVEGSYCSSLGKYKIGVSSYSNWGINVHYKLHGLEETNSNAFKRIVVLHSYAPVPSSEIYPRHLPMGYSQGCPVINDEVMTEIDKLMKQKSKPVLLWIYN